MKRHVQDAAYFAWESAGRQQGKALDYWLKAEKEFLSTIRTTAMAMFPAGNDKTPVPEIMLPGEPTAMFPAGNDKTPVPETKKLKRTRK